MRKLRRFLLGPKGQTHCYHVVSRFAGRHIVFGESEREFFRTLLGRQLRFSCLGNHFHLLLEVPDKERALAGWTQEDFLQRLQLLADEPYTRKLLAEVAQCQADGDAGTQGANAIGTWKGKHRALPHIRPGKTWEGCGGAFLGAFVGAVWVLLGSTGSIGASALKVAREIPERMEIVGLAANASYEVLRDQVRETGVRHVCLRDSAAAARLRAALPDATVFEREEGLRELAAVPKADLVLVSLLPPDPCEHILGRHELG